MQPIAERTTSQKAFLPRYVLAVAGGIALAGLAAALFPLLMPIGALPVACVYVASRLARSSPRYRLFPDRLEIETGLLGRNIESIDLFRIRDIGLQQGLLGRLGDFGDLQIRSTDSSAPAVRLRAIDAPREFYDQLRARTAASRSRNRTVLVDEALPLAEP